MVSACVDRGDADAMNNAGVMYAEGEGVGRDLVQAQLWFTLGAMMGNDLARENRDLYASGWVVRLKASTGSMEYFPTYPFAGTCKLMGHDPYNIIARVVGAKRNPGLCTAAVDGRRAIGVNTLIIGAVAGIGK